ncbi:ArsA family ATPase [Halocatena pleomorpha]|uniref:ATPase n=1 Tax=Halocatena pleomorpha TaxID=1785090 RepID=A0A3P3RC11_9EURY|nr:ArsA family ATPase [Halocatena pleomorpha]RRJ31017.1 ATPase [Halocatena pleomorpha]
MGSFAFFGGKGGVGKTTVASAHALRCSRTGDRTLVVSTDPAHSTSDVFEQEFGDEPTPVDGYEDLFAMEIDPDAEIDEHLQETKRALDDHVSASMVNTIDRQIELAHRTPGAYEAALFDRFIDVMANAEAYDRVVFDTAPTGGTLRLLSLPDALDGWIERLIEKRTQSIDLFEKAAIGDREARRKVETDPIIARLQGRKERFEFAGRMLRDSATFYLVLTPDELSIRETRRTIEDFTDHGLSVSGLVVNRLTPQPDDDEQGQGGQFLRQRCATERERLDTIQTLAPSVVATIQTRAGEIKGDLLEDVASDLSVER